MDESRGSASNPAGLVVVNRQRQTGILVKQGSKYVHVVRLTRAGITLDRIEEDAFVAEWAKLEGYDVLRAIEQYRAHGEARGITQAARTALDELSEELSQ